MKERIIELSVDNRSEVIELPINPKTVEFTSKQLNQTITLLEMGEVNLPMLNPVIVKKSKPYETEEGCLSLEGVRRTTRYETIEVEYRDANFKRCKQRYTGWTAQIIQHEIDHCDGILI